MPIWGICLSQCLQLWIQLGPSPEIPKSSKDQSAENESFKLETKCVWSPCSMLTTRSARSSLFRCSGHSSLLVKPGFHPHPHSLHYHHHCKLSRDVMLPMVQNDLSVTMQGSFVSQTSQCSILTLTFLMHNQKVHSGILTKSKEQSSVPFMTVPSTSRH